MSKRKLSIRTTSDPQASPLCPPSPSQSISTELEPSVPTNSDQGAISLFIRQTYKLLQENRFPDIISWGPKGNSIEIYKPEEFSSKVLPVYFKHSQLASFVRQLNLYSFKKCRTVNLEHIYMHEMFQKDKPQLLKEIKRKSQDQSLLLLQKAIENSHSSTENDAMKMSSLSYENVMLKKLHKDSLARISSLERRNRDMTIQNQALWNHINEQEAREAALKSMINKVLVTYDIQPDALLSICKNGNLLEKDTLKGNNKLLSEFPLASSRIRREQTQPQCIDIGSFLNISEGTSTENEAVNSPSTENKRSASTKDGENNDEKDKESLLKCSITGICDSKGKDTQQMRVGTWTLEFEYLRNLAADEEIYNKSVENTSGVVESRKVLGKREQDNEENNENQAGNVQLTDEVFEKPEKRVNK